MALRGTTSPVAVFRSAAPPCVDITLDTTPPVVAWGAVAGTTAGELLQVLYTLDEPDLLDATLTFVDGSELGMAVLEDRLTVLLPADAYDGPARVRARVRDDVGNETIRELVVVLTGTPYVPPEQPIEPARSPGWPVRPRRRIAPQRVVRVRSHARVSSSARVTATRRVRERSAVVSHGRLVVRRSSVATVVTRSHATVAQQHVTTTVMRVTSRAVVRRRDGAEDEALLLGLL